MVGTGDATTNEGVAVAIYCANRSMGKRAFCNNDGDFLILPQQGRLDIQTEFGKYVQHFPQLEYTSSQSRLRMMVRPGELAVIQAGIYFTVNLPDGNSRGCEFRPSLPFLRDGPSLLTPDATAAARQMSRSSLEATTSCRSWGPSEATDWPCRGTLSSPSHLSTWTSQNGRVSVDLFSLPCGLCLVLELTPACPWAASCHQARRQALDLQEEPLTL